MKYLSIAKLAKPMSDADSGRQDRTFEPVREASDLVETKAAQREKAQKRQFKGDEADEHRSLAGAGRRKHEG